MGKQSSESTDKVWYVGFGRYVENAIPHCENQARAEYLLEELQQRIAHCGLELHPRKTKIFYGQGKYKGFDSLWGLRFTHVRRCLCRE
ncbi:hypothetical protein [Pasteuria penetrans]|uniref:hypothetical protein n=1 Tax=Pasteuria penetrans TaxID=86005 RepID=UPI000FA76B3B|nr:hypothetical protein [Pasteuria penetrans]